MAMLAKLYGSGRTAERHVIEADATLRDQDHVPVDVLVADLSTTGCLFVCAVPFALEGEMTLGITGLGRHRVRIVRVLDQRYGCEFVTPLTDAEVATASTTPADTIVHFPTGRLDAAFQEDDVSRADRLPGPVRLAVVIGAPVLMWSAVLAALTWLR